MSRWLRVVVLAALVLGLAPIGSASAQVALPPNCERIDLANEVYVICPPWLTPPPTGWDLVVFAHGYVAPDKSADSFFDQLYLPDGTPLPTLVNSLGFVFAATSYTKNGLAVKNGVDDVGRLIDFISAQYGSPAHVYLIGVSEGALVTTLAIEKQPARYAGAVAACGPVGDFKGQVNYWGNFRVLYDYFYPAQLFPAVQIPYSPIKIDQSTVWPNWDLLSQAIGGSILSNTDRTKQLLRTSRAPIDAADPTSAAATTVGILSYNVFATNEAIKTLGGQPFDNRTTIYFGSNNDLALNRSVARFKASPPALKEIDRYYQTSGRLTKPLVTLHNTGDPIVPYWHETLYNLKVLRAGSGAKHINLPVVRYGHCNFTASEALTAFGLMINLATGTLPTIDETQIDAQVLSQYKDMVKTYLPKK